MYEYIYLTHGSVNVVKNAIVPMIYNFKAIKKIPTDFSQEECGKWPANFNIFMEIQRSKIRSRNAKFPILLEMKTCTATVILRVTWPVARHKERRNARTFGHGHTHSMVPWFMAMVGRPGKSTVLGEMWGNRNSPSEQ